MCVYMYIILYIRNFSNFFKYFLITLEIIALQFFFFCKNLTVIIISILITLLISCGGKLNTYLFDISNNIVFS